MNRLYAAGLIGCLWMGSISVHAQQLTKTEQAITVASFTALAVGNTLDLISTAQVIDRGGYESNPILGHGVVQIAITKIAIGTALGMWMFHEANHGHPKRAAVIGIFAGGVTISAAIHNHGVK